MQPQKGCLINVDAHLPAFAGEIECNGNMAKLVLQINNLSCIHGPQMKGCSEVLESEKMHSACKYLKIGVTIFFFIPSFICLESISGHTRASKWVVFESIRNTASSKMRQKYKN